MHRMRSSLQFLVYGFILIGEWKPKKSYCVIKSFSVQVFILWTVLCIPGNVVTTYLYHTSNNNSTTTLEESVENISSLKCHEQKSNWNHTLSATRFALEGSTYILLGLGRVENFMSRVRFFHQD